MSATGNATRTAIVVRTGLPTWQALNITAFLASGLASDAPNIIGAPYHDAQGDRYCRMFTQPVIVFEAMQPRLSSILSEAKMSGLVIALFTEELLKTNNDIDNRAAFAAFAPADMRLLGIGLFGSRKIIGKLLKDVAKHP